MSREFKEQLSTQSNTTVITNTVVDTAKTSKNQSLNHLRMLEKQLEEHVSSFNRLTIKYEKIVLDSA